ncbi:MAG: hypothetical protein ACLP3R_26350, partial [Candidatus Korobacteraceae bacterium]
RAFRDPGVATLSTIVIPTGAEGSAAQPLIAMVWIQVEALAFRDCVASVKRVSRLEQAAQ